MDQLIQLLQESLSTFTNAMIEIGAAEQRQEQDKKMDIQQPKYIQQQCFDQKLKGEEETDIQFNFFERLGDGVYNQALDAKISNIKMNSVSLRRKDELFKRHKREQQQKIVQRRKQLQQKYSFNQNQLKFQGEFILRKNDKNQIFAFKIEDFEKLRPETDLNDTVIDNYLKIMQATLLPQETSNKTFIFSTFFMGKLLGDQLRDDMFPERENQNTAQKIQKKVTQAYPTMKRWTKKLDVFQKEYLVIPINAYKHWNCMIVVAPNALLTEPGQCKIFYLDSMFEKKLIFPEAIKTFLQLELADRKKINLSLQNVVQTYQLLVPRQTNTHDCGLYTLCYIEHFLKNHYVFEQNMQNVSNRYHLRIFPRSIIFTMRECLRQLFRNLLNYENKEQAIKQYLKLRQQIERESNQSDFDIINERQFKKYYRLNSHLLEDKKKKQSEIQYQCKVKFYLDCQINHYEKDQSP